VVIGRKAAKYVLVGAASILFVWAWQSKFANDNDIVVYFGRPKLIASYIFSSGHELLMPAVWCFLVALGCLLLAATIVVALIVLGLSSNRRLAAIEHLGAVAQTIPVLVIVTLFLIGEREIAKLLGIQPSADWFCVLPVTVGLMFPPLVNGTSAILHMPLQVKALLRMWNAPKKWRTWKVYIPYAIPQILSGVRASATWAVGATLIAEGMLNGVSKSNNTLGYFLIRPYSSNNVRTTAVIIISSFLGYAVYWISGAIERYIQKRLLGQIDIDESGYPLQSSPSVEQENAYAS
jgi:NitT/TauT family transport system permease protein